MKKENVCNSSALRLNCYKCMLIIILSALIIMSGCHSKNSEEGSKEGYMGNKMATEEQIEILKDSGLKSSEIEEIREKGMSLATQSYVEVSQKMLSYLEEKYDTSFKIGGGSIPGLLSNDYSMIAYAVRGTCPYEKFDVTYQTDKDGNGYFEDGYFALLKSQEVQEELQNIADEEGVDAKIIASLDGRVGKDCTKDTTLKEALEKGEYIEAYVFGLASSELTEKEFNTAAQKLEEKYKQVGVDISYVLYHLVDNSLREEVYTYEDLHRNKTVSTNTNYDLRYYKYIYVSE